MRASVSCNASVRKWPAPALQRIVPWYVRCVWLRSGSWLADLLVNVHVKPLVIGEMMYISPVLMRGFDVNRRGVDDPYGVLRIVKSVRCIVHFHAHSGKPQVAQAGSHFGLELDDGA